MLTETLESGSDAEPKLSPKMWIVFGGSARVGKQLMA